jgi:hypothetical protein
MSMNQEPGKTLEFISMVKGPIVPNKKKTASARRRRSFCSIDFHKFIGDLFCGIELSVIRFFYYGRRGCSVAGI